MTEFTTTVVLENVDVTNLDNEANLRYNNIKWTNGQIRTMLRAISCVSNGAFQEMLEELNDEEKMDKINLLRQGWTTVQRMMKREHPGTRLSARQISEKFRKLSHPPGSKGRKSVDELMLLHRAPSLAQHDPTSDGLKFLKMELDEVEPLINESEELKDRLSPNPSMTATPRSLRKRKARGVPIKFEDEYQEFDPESLQLLTTKTSLIFDQQSVEINEEKLRLEVEVLELERDAKKKKLLVWETIKRKVSDNGFDVSSLLKQ